MDSDKTHGRIEDGNDKRREQNASTSERDADNRNNENQDQQGADHCADDDCDNQEEKSDSRSYQSSSKKPDTDRRIL